MFNTESTLRKPHAIKEETESKWAARHICGECEKVLQPLDAGVLVCARQVPGL